MANLLARFAENTFWLARYMERAENLARILHVNETAARNSQGETEWGPIVEINADESRFYQKHARATRDAVTHFYIFDADNPTSIRTAVHQARENARTIRHLISTEMWQQLNVFHKKLTALGPAAVRGPGLYDVCRMVKESCQAHDGVAAATIYRDETFVFYYLGKFIERADQTTRLLDIKYRYLPQVATEDEDPVSMGQWNALLRSAAAYQAFRRVHPRGMRSADVAAFMIFDRRFPRSVALSVRSVDEMLSELRATYGLRPNVDAMEALDSLRANLDGGDIEGIFANGMHSYVDYVQRQLVAVSYGLGQSFFGHAF